MDFHPLATHISFPSRRAPSVMNGGPSRIVFVTSEHFEEGNRGVTHLFLDIKGQRIKQALPFDVASDLAKTMMGNFGRAGRACIFVTLDVRASEIQDLPDEDLAWIASVLAPVCKEFDIPAAGVPFLGSGAGSLSSMTSPARMNLLEWGDFNGFCGLQHLPAITRWDPGALNSERLYEHLRRLGVPNADGTTDPVPEPAPVEPEVVEEPEAPAEEPIHISASIEELAETMVKPPEFVPERHANLPQFRGKEMKPGSKAKSVAIWQAAIGAEVTGVHDEQSVAKTKELQEFFGLVEVTGNIERDTWNRVADL